MIYLNNLNKTIKKLLQHKPYLYNEHLHSIKNEDIHKDTQLKTLLFQNNHN